jgi:diaminopimelate decarboxylase
MIAPDIIELCRSLQQRISTPFYLIDLDRIERAIYEFYSVWKKEFPHVRLAYSYKSNSLEAITRLVRQQGHCAEVVSGTELLWALQDGFLPEQIFFDGPVKKREELELALSHGVNIQVDSLDELDLLIALCPDRKPACKISLRLTGEGKQGGKSRFGLLEKEFIQAIEKLRKVHLIPSGLHMHLGSNLNDPQIYAQGLEQAANQIHLLRKLSLQPIWLDVGGGYPSQSVGKDKQPVPVSAFAQVIKEFFLREKIDLNSITLINEPGRCLVEDYGYLVSSICVRKERNGKQQLIADGGLHLVRSLPSWYHPIILVPHSQGSRSIFYDVYGANCFESDLLAKDLASHDEVGPGDLLIIGSSGGYDIPNAHVWTRPLPLIYGSKSGEVQTIDRRSQTSI